MMSFIFGLVEQPRQRRKAIFYEDDERPTPSSRSRRKRYTYFLSVYQKYSLLDFITFCSYLFAY